MRNCLPIGWASALLVAYSHFAVAGTVETVQSHGQPLEPASAAFVSVDAPGNLELTSRAELQKHRLRPQLVRRVLSSAETDVRQDDHGAANSLLDEGERRQGSAPQASPSDSNELTLSGCHTGPDATPGVPHVEVKPYKIELTSYDKRLMALGDRLVKLADGSEAMKACGSFFCYGDYCWCNKVMPAESASFAELNPFQGSFCEVSGKSALQVRDNFKDFRQANNNQFEGISYGIDDTDGWSELMSSQYFLVTRLYDCYVRSGLGPMFNDMHGNFSRENPCQTRGCYSVPYQYHRICVGDQDKVEDGYKFETMKSHLNGRGPLSTFIKMDVEGYEFPILDKLLKDETELKKIRTIDLEIHMTFGGSLDYNLERRVDVLERLAKRFMVTGTSIQPMFRAAFAEFQHQRQDDPKFKQQPYDIYTSDGMPLVQYVMSFANRDLFTL